MGVKIFCDRCERFIKNVSTKRIRSLDGQVFVCQPCVAAETKNAIEMKQWKVVTSASITKTVRTAQEEINKIIKNAQEEYQKLLKQQVKRKGKNGTGSRNLGRPASDVPK